MTLALSGGVDSVALLDILVSLRTALGFQLSALYVNHGLSSNASAWGRFCAALCLARGVVFSEALVNLDRASGDSLEALAREARYREFARLGADYVVLAHHLDDQAETVLLQLLRGAGLRGLSAMPEHREDSGPAILRPLIEVARADIFAYAQARRLEWIEDESNRDVAFDRNFLRHEIFPEVARRFPGYRQALLRASRHAAEAALLLNEMAVADSAGAIRDGRLEVGVLRALPPIRAKNLLRWHLEGCGVIMPPAVRLEEMLRQLNGARPDAQVQVRVGAHELRRYRDQIYVLPRHVGDATEFAVEWHFQERLEIPGGTVCFESRKGEGISLAKLQAGKLVVRTRTGMDSLRPDCRRPSRSLKNLFQENRVPPWERAVLPMLYCGKRLVWVPGLGVDCTFQASPGEDGVLAIHAKLL